MMLQAKIWRWQTDCWCYPKRWHLRRFGSDIKPLEFGEDKEHVSIDSEDEDEYHDSVGIEFLMKYTEEGHYSNWKECWDVKILHILVCMIQKMELIQLGKIEKGLVSAQRKYTYLYVCWFRYKPRKGGESNYKKLQASNNVYI